MEKLIEKIIEHYEWFREPYKNWDNKKDVAHAIYESFKPEIKSILPNDSEVEKWFIENIENPNGCSASSAIYKFRLWLKERI